MSAVELSAGRFRLVPLAPADREELFAHLSDPATVEHMDLVPLADVAAADAVIAWAMGLATAGEGVRWAIRDAAGAFVGTAGFNSLVRHRAARGEVAYDVVTARRRQGVMAEVLPAVLHHGFATLGLRRIEALVTPGNAASVGLLERFGFRREGVLRDHGFWKGRFWDQWLYARRADD